MPDRPAPVLCAGEVLWDSVPSGLHLGGAPFNVAYHLARLGRPAALASRVGDDALGREAARRVALAGVGAGLVQTDPARPTGFVRVALDAEGVPSYDVERPAAWDALALTEPLAAAAAAAPAVVFGTLAQRDETSRRTLRAVVDAAPLAVLDVNLRPPFVDPDRVSASLAAADVVKLSEDELVELAGWFGLPDDREPAAQALAAQFGCPTVCVTRGGDGAALWHGGAWSRHGGVPTDVADTVGAGDAFLAALLDALLAGRPADVALDRACRLGSLVASLPGAAPAYDPAVLDAGLGPL